MADADEDVRLLAAAQAVVELGDDARAQPRAELAERAGPLGDRDGEDRLARLAELGALGDEAQAVEVHVRAAEDRRHAARSPRDCAATQVFSPATASAPAGSMMLRVSSKTSLIAAQISSLVTRTTSSTACCASAKVCSPTSRTATPSAKMPDVVEAHAMAGRQRLVHRVGLERLDADDLHVRHAAP